MTITLFCEGWGRKSIQSITLPNFNIYIIFAPSFRYFFLLKKQDAQNNNKPKRKKRKWLFFLNFQEALRINTKD